MGEIEEWLIWIKPSKRGEIQKCEDDRVIMHVLGGGEKMRKMFVKRMSCNSDCLECWMSKRDQ